MRKLFYVDVETGGVNPDTDALLQVSGIIEIDGEEKERFNYLIKPFPGDNVNDEALRVNGLTLDDINSDKFKAPQVVYRELMQLLSKYVDKYDRSDKFNLVGYNIGVFDEPFLRRFFLKNGDNYFGSFFRYPPLDVFYLAVWLLELNGITLVNRKLMTVASYFKIPIDESRLHDAVYDIEVTRELSKRLIDRIIALNLEV